MSFAWTPYLKRIQLDEQPQSDEAGLRALHDGQFYNIPFENFDIHLGRGISLGPEDVFDKLVNHRRGGYCFELNSLMLRALRAAGFRARPLLARVHLGPEPLGRTHQVSLVEIGQQPWLMDVGFGAGGLRCPLPLEIGYCEQGPDWGFRLVVDEKWGTMMQSYERGQWKDSYSFDLSFVCAADIAVGNYYTATAPDSHFVTSRKASRPLLLGRVSLLDNVLTRIHGMKKTTEEVPSGAAYLEVLADVFDIDLGVPYEELRSLPPSG